MNLLRFCGFHKVKSWWSVGFRAAVAVLALAWRVSTSEVCAQRSSEGNFQLSTASPFPSPPESPSASSLPPLDQERQWHGGSFLYDPPQDPRHLGYEPLVPYEYLRLPPGWHKPRPWTWGAEFLGTDPVFPSRGKWFGSQGYHWETRMVVYGLYRLLGIALDTSAGRQDLLGHQLLLELDWRLTGTERVHVQMVPLGNKRSGGSYYRFSDPEGYVDNATAVPDRYWVELELESVLGHWLQAPRLPADWNVAMGQVPVWLHNGLLVNDDMLGVVVSKNTLIQPPWSNLNLMAFAFLDDVDALPGISADLYGLHLSMDLHGHFWEFSYLHYNPRRVVGRNADYVAWSYTHFWGLWTITGRVMLKNGDRLGSGSGQLYAVELLRKVKPSGPWLARWGVDQMVWYATGIRTVGGWNSPASGTFDRLTLTFELDPLITVPAAPDASDTYAVALGCMIQGHHQHWALIPEVAWQQPQHRPVWGASITWWCKLGRRSFVQVRGLWTGSSHAALRRRGVLVAWFWLF